MKKITTLLMVITFVASILIGCVKTEQNPSATDSVAVDSTIVADSTSIAN